MRFPAPTDFADTRNCPFCDDETIEVGPVQLHPPRHPARFTTPIEVVVDNIRSAHNVGEILRTADGAGVTHVHLCGYTAGGDHPKVRKTSLGAEGSVPWSRSMNALDVIDRMEKRGMRIWALESTPSSEPLFSGVLEASPASTPPGLVLVVGNETAGVDHAILERAERHVELPMAGEKNSLNAAMALAVALYWVRSQETPSL